MRNMDDDVMKNTAHLKGFCDRGMKGFKMVALSPLPLLSKTRYFWTDENIFTAEFK